MVIAITIVAFDGSRHTSVPVEVLTWHDAVSRAKAYAHEEGMYHKFVKIEFIERIDCNITKGDI